MKKYLLILSVLLCSLASQAQFNVYHPFPDSNAYWNEDVTWLTYCYTTDPVFPIRYFDYYLAGDTVMNGKTYHELNTSGGEEVCYVCCGPEVVWQNYDYRIGYLREDTNRRVYYRPLGKRDTLLYDFNLKVGDTLPATYNNDTSYRNNNNYVYSIDSILVGGSYRRQFIISRGSSSRGFDSITEGIGSALGLLETIIPPFEAGSQLLCFSQNGSTVYPDSRVNCSRFYLSVPRLNSAPLSLLLYPNPASTSITIGYQLPQGLNNAVLKLYNEMGQLMQTETISAASGTLEEDVSSLSNGVYYYSLSINGVTETTNKLVVIH